jgi:hypothetical protein
VFRGLERGKKEKAYCRVRSKLLTTHTRNNNKWGRQLIVNGHVISFGISLLEAAGRRTQE